MSRKELIAQCKEKGIKGYSTKNKNELLTLLAVTATATATATATTTPLRQEVIQGDCLQLLPILEDNSAQIIIADPPYNIGKDFGNDSDKQPMDMYLAWTEKWLAECLRVLQPNGTMFI
jgi:predicted methyltransferase